MIAAADVVLEFYCDLAWDKYCEASERVTVWLAGSQLDLFDSTAAYAELREWGGIWQSVERELYARRAGR